MDNQLDDNWIFDRDYCGRILGGQCSNELKKRVADAISLFRNFNSKAIPAMPYISAWREDADKAIWYEFAGSRLLALLGCQSCEVAEIFRGSVLKRCSYRHSPAGKKIERRTVEQADLHCLRDELRNEGKNRGTVEAVYKISLPDRPPVWLKDQATVEAFAADRICLSLGWLTDVTLEMEADEQQQEGGQLRRHYAQLEEKIEKQQKELWMMQVETIYRLARAAQFRDQSTGPHITKMSHYCDILARAVGLNDQERELLFHAIAMHDVGKLAIADDILHKPEKLSREEFAIMQTHCIIGAQLLSGNDSPLLQMAKNIALTHHESWDGTGYPQGLAGEQIPMTGRMAAICDVFDALTSARPYKQPWPLDEAFAELERGMGLKFDPQLIALFLEKKADIALIQQRFSAAGTGGQA